MTTITISNKSAKLILGLLLAILVSLWFSILYFFFQISAIKVSTSDVLRVTDERIEVIKVLAENDKELIQRLGKLEGQLDIIVRSLTPPEEK